MRASSAASAVATGASTCFGCTRTLRRGTIFSFKSGKSTQSDVAKCLLCSLRHWPMLRRSLLTALVVGTILTLLNQGDKVLTGSWTSGLYWKVPLTYCVPFLVVTWGGLSSSRR